MAAVPRSLEDFEALLIEGIDPVSAPSVAYGIARGEETLLIGAAGVADKACGMAATTKTAYSLASVTKPITTTAVMMLAERGLVDLDAPIGDYLGSQKLLGKAGDVRGATVRRVADHTAGLPLFYTFFYGDEAIRRPPFEETVARYGLLVTPPGERHQYSNLGYGLLDDLIARVSGMPYAQFVTDRIFRPLGMVDSTVDAPTAGNFAIAYGPDGVGYPPYDFDHPGGSAVYSSVEDMLAFGRFHLGYGPSLLSPEGRRSMQVPTSIDAHREYGFGWGVNTGRHGRTLVGHTGGMGGVNTILRLVPELDLVITILVNGQSDLPFLGADNALAALDPTFRAGLLSEREAPKLKKEAIPIPSDLWGGWHGLIETHGGELPFGLEIRSGTEALATLDGIEGFVDELQMQSGRLVGVFDGSLGTEDTARRPYRIHLDLGIRGDVLDGAATAIATFEGKGGGAPERRLGNALPHWTLLRRS